MHLWWLNSFVEYTFHSRMSFLLPTSTSYKSLGIIFITIHMMSISIKRLIAKINVAKIFLHLKSANLTMMEFESFTVLTNDAIIHKDCPIHFSHLWFILFHLTICLQKWHIFLHNLTKIDVKSENQERQYRPSMTRSKLHVFHLYNHQVTTSSILYHIHSLILFHFSFSNCV